MAKTTTGKNGFLDMTKVFGDFRLLAFDAEAIIEAQRKNIETAVQAHRMAVDGVRALVQRQTEIVQQTVEEASGLLCDWTQPIAPDERIVRTADAAKVAFEKGLANARELNELGSKASSDAFSVIARRVSESFDEVRHYARRRAAAE